MQKYLESKFGDALEDVLNAMMELAKSLPPAQLAEKAYSNDIINLPERENIFARIVEKGKRNHMLTAWRFR